MKAIILAAGKGTRMGELTEDNQKAMLLVDGKPKLARSIENLPDIVDEVILVVGYKKELVKDFFGSKYNGKKITYLEQTELNGTAGSLLLAKDLISDNEKFLVTMADDFYKKSDLEKLLECDFSILALHTKNAKSFGILETDESGFLTSVVEKPHNKEEGYVNIAGYSMKKEYFDTEMVAISDTEFGLPQTLVKMSKDKNINIKVVEAENWFAMGDPEAYKIAQEKYKEFEN